MEAESRPCKLCGWQFFTTRWEWAISCHVVFCPALWHSDITSGSVHLDHWTIATDRLLSIHHTSRWTLPPVMSLCHSEGRLLLPSKQLGGSEALTCLYINLPFFRNKSVQEIALSSALGLGLVRVSALTWNRENWSFLRLDFITTTSTDARRGLCALLCWISD